MRERYGAIFFVSLTIVATTLGATATYAQAVDQRPPPRPEWVDADGKLKPGGPREISVVGPDGKPLQEASGAYRKVPK